MFNEAMNIIPDSDGFYHVEQAEIDVAEIARLDYIDNAMKSGSETFNDELNVLFTRSYMIIKMMLWHILKIAWRQWNQVKALNDQNGNLGCTYCYNKFDFEKNVFMLMASH